MKDDGSLVSLEPNLGDSVQSAAMSRKSQLIDGTQRVCLFLWFQFLIQIHHSGCFGNFGDS